MRASAHVRRLGMGVPRCAKKKLAGVHRLGMGVPRCAKKKLAGVHRLGMGVPRCAPKKLDAPPPLDTGGSLAALGMTAHFRALEFTGSSQHRNTHSHAQRRASLWALVSRLLQRSPFATFANATVIPSEARDPMSLPGDEHHFLGLEPPEGASAESIRRARRVLLAQPRRDRTKHALVCTPESKQIRMCDGEVMRAHLEQRLFRRAYVMVRKLRSGLGGQCRPRLPPRTSMAA